MLNFTKSPDRYISLPVYAGERQWTNSSKAGRIWAPKVTTLDMDNLFGCRSLCILDFISSAGDGKFDKPLYMIVLVQTGVKSAKTGWMCEYDPGAKVIMLNDVADNKARPKPKRPAPVVYGSKLDTFSNFEDDDFGDRLDCEWGESSAPESQSDGGDSNDARNLRKYIDGVGDDREEKTREMGKSINALRYVVYASVRRNQITARWMEREERAQRQAYRRDVKKIREIPSSKVLRGSRASEISKHGFPECAKRAEEWQNCHSDAALLF